MVDFINEVEEELRKDKYNVLLRKFGPYILAIIFAIVAGSGYVEYRKFSTGKVARAASSSFVVAANLAEKGDLQAAIRQFDALAEVAPSGYAGLSLSRAAGLKVQLGDMDGAVAYFDRSAQAFTRPIHKDLSSLKSAYILLDQGRYDDVKARIATLILDDAPFQDLAKELSAHASMKTQDIEGARAQFTYLANAPGVLPGVKARAQQAVTLLNANRKVGGLNTDVQTLPAPEAVAPIEELVEEPTMTKIDETSKD